MERFLTFCRSRGSGERGDRRFLLRRPGFTLIELLVVIAVIALIAAILFPVFSRAREKGRQAACVAHVRQLTSAFHMYSEDFDEQFPPDFSRGRGITTFEEASGMWYAQLQPYIRNLGVLHCPSDNISDALRTTSACAPWLRGDRRLPALSYGANSVLILAWYEPTFRQFQTVPSISRPAHTLLFGDSTEPWVFHFCPDTDRSGVHWSHAAYANGPPECREDYHGGHSGEGDERHTAGSNLAYVDGHVQYMPADRFLCRVLRRGRLTFYQERPLIRPDALTPDELPPVP
jgi:prepilin-type N-terminal cleavage/methylation domain-containing protein/prepilin-type processing-associated H-X9-DG protein